MQVVFRARLTVYLKFTKSSMLKFVLDLIIL